MLLSNERGNLKCLHVGFRNPEVSSLQTKKSNHELLIAVVLSLRLYTPTPTITMARNPEPRTKYRLALLTILGISLHSLFLSPSIQRRSLRVNISDAKYLHRTDSTLPPWAHFNLKSVHSKPDEEESAVFWHIPKVCLMELAAILQLVHVIYLLYM